MKKKRLLTDRTNGLEDQMMELMAKEMQQEMDAEIMRSLLVESGWHEVKLWVMTHEVGDQIDLWVKKNIKGDVWARGIVWLFKEQRDANWFAMRWLS